jgi:hypothetical protein
MSFWSKQTPPSTFLCFSQNQETTVLLKHAIWLISSEPEWPQQKPIITEISFVPRGSVMVSKPLWPTSVLWVRTPGICVAVWENPREWVLLRQIFLEGLLLRVAVPVLTHETWVHGEQFQERVRPLRFMQTDIAVLLMEMPRSSDITAVKSNAQASSSAQIACGAAWKGTVNIVTENHNETMTIRWLKWFQARFMGNWESFEISMKIWLPAQIDGRLFIVGESGIHSRIRLPRWDA